MPRKTTSLKAVATIGIDIGKNTFHLIGLDKMGAIVLHQKLSRGQVDVRLAKKLLRDIEPAPNGTSGESSASDPARATGTTGTTTAGSCHAGHRNGAYRWVVATRCSCPLSSTCSGVPPAPGAPVGPQFQISGAASTRLSFARRFLLPPLRTFRKSSRSGARRCAFPQYGRRRAYQVG